MCFRPNQAYYGPKKLNGKNKIVFSEHLSDSSHVLKLPCGQCVDCRLKRSSAWATRCMHEAQMHEHNCYITLSYNDKFLPKNRSLNYPDFQKFFKRLRRKFGNGIRFYMCGEYGDKNGRPHYHAIIFGFDFSDRELFKYSNGFPLYRSKDLEELWSHPRTGESFGYSSVADVSFESAAYVARYIMKKVTGKAAYYHYMNLDYDTGELQVDSDGNIISRVPEFNKMSNRYAIGKSWFDLYHCDVYPRDECRVWRKDKMVSVRPPKYYDKLFEKIDPFELDYIKHKRVINAAIYADNNTPERLIVREAKKLLDIQRLVRPLGSEVL